MAMSRIDREILLNVKGTQCCNCLEDVGKGIIFHHIVPEIYGGQDILSNIVGLCSNCHGLLHSKNKNPLSNSELVKEGMRKAKEKGVKLGRHPISEEKINEAITLYQEDKLTISEIEKKCNISRNSIYKYLHKNGIPLKK